MRHRPTNEGPYTLLLRVVLVMVVLDLILLAGLGYTL